MNLIILVGDCFISLVPICLNRVKLFCEFKFNCKLCLSVRTKLALHSAIIKFQLSSSGVIFKVLVKHWFSSAFLCNYCKTLSSTFDIKSRKFSKDLDFKVHLYLPKIYWMKTIQLGLVFRSKYFWNIKLYFP